MLLLLCGNIAAEALMEIFKRYSELIMLSTFEERFDYLKLNGSVGRDTFGFDRVFNQMFYNSLEWKQCRDKIIARDLGCDLGVPGHEIFGSKVVIHHMNPITLEDLDKKTEILLDPEYLITTTHFTHNAIHYGDSNFLVSEPIERKKNDTCPWKR